jgi:hypothetical protein
VSKYLVKLSSIYEDLDLREDSTMDQGNCSDVSDEFDVIHKYQHPTSKKKCYCMMRRHAAGYNIVDMDEDGNQVADASDMGGGEENAEARLVPGAMTAKDLALVRQVAGGQTQGGTNSVSAPQKDVESAYGVLLKKLSTKIKNVASQIQA